MPDGLSLRRLARRTASFAIIAMLTGVSYWFRADGRLGRTSVMEEHTIMALHMARLSVSAKSLAAFFARAAARMDAPEPLPAVPSRAA